jgi:protein SCO1/2
VLAAVADAQEVPAPAIGFEQRLDESVPLDLIFRDEKGEQVKLGSYFRSKPVILVLAYYRCPRLCSLVLNGLVESMQRMKYDVGDQFKVVTVSIDPRETPPLAAAKKEAYVEHYGRPGAADGWHFLVGDETELKRLADAVGFRFAYDSARDQYDHAAGIMVVTPQGKIARYLFGVSFSARDLGFALEDAAAGKIGSPVARPLRLLCYAYDPEAGRYTLATMRLIRWGGLLTMLVLGAFLWRAWRRERKPLATRSAEP